MGRNNADFFKYSTSYNKFIDNSDDFTLPGFSKYKKTTAPAENRVLHYLEGGPLFKDVRNAHYSGRITTEEAQDLRPGDTIPSRTGMFANKSDKATHRRAGLKEVK
jgi:hypothetical protein